jgi:hypothetical protein
MGSGPNPKLYQSTHLHHYNSAHLNVNASLTCLLILILVLFLFIIIFASVPNRIKILGILLCLLTTRPSQYSALFRIKVIFLDISSS